MKIIKGQGEGRNGGRVQSGAVVEWNGIDGWRAEF